MRLYVFIVLSLCYIKGLHCLCPDIQLPDEISFPETTKNGSVVFTSNVTVDSVDNLWGPGNTAFQLHLNQTTLQYEIILTTSPNLDVKDPLQRCLIPRQYNMSYVCREGGQEKSVGAMFTIQDVDEFPAQFLRQGSDLGWVSVTLNENTPPGKVLATLDENKFTDADCYSRYSFTLAADISGDPADLDYFTINSSNQVVLNKMFDADMLKCGYGSQLNKKVDVKLLEEDYHQKTRKDTITMDVKVIDLDDQAPMFVKPGCTDTCPPCVVNGYDLSITTSDVGKLNVTIQALDTDTVNSHISYHITKVEEEKYAQYFTLDEDTAELSLTTTFGDVLNGTGVYEDFTISVMLQARENSTGQISDNVTVTITVVVPETTTQPETTTTEEITTTEETTTTTLPTTTESTTSTPSPTTTPVPTTPTVAASNTDSNKSVNILYIILPIVAGVLLIALIITIVYWRRRKQAYLRYKLRQEKTYLGSKEDNLKIDTDEINAQKKANALNGDTFQEQDINQKGFAMENPVFNHEDETTTVDETEKNE